MMPHSYDKLGCEMTKLNLGKQHQDKMLRDLSKMSH